MCFSETQSYINSAMLIMTGMYTYPNYKLSLFAIVFSMKELLQGLIYRYQGNPILLKRVGIFSWLIISFIPLILNIFFSHFSPKFAHWNVVFMLCLVLGIVMTMELNELDIQDDPDCISQGATDDYCKPTGGYIGKYHVGYNFRLDREWKPFSMFYYWNILFFIPVLFTNARLIGVVSILLTSAMIILYNYLNNITHFTSTERFGEKASIWCFFTIIVIPLILFEKTVKKWL